MLPDWCEAFLPGRGLDERRLKKRLLYKYEIDTLVFMIFYHKTIEALHSINRIARWPERKFSKAFDGALFCFFST